MRNNEKIVLASGWPVNYCSNHLKISQQHSENVFTIWLVGTFWSQLVRFGNIMITCKKLNNILNKFQMFPLGMWWKHFQNVIGEISNDCWLLWGSNVVYMLMLHSKCCINVPIGSRLNTWSGYIWNVPNLLLAGKLWVPSTRAYNVFKIFLLVSRPPCPQWQPPRAWMFGVHQIGWGWGWVMAKHWSTLQPELEGPRPQQLPGWPSGQHVTPIFMHCEYPILNLGESAWQVDWSSEYLFQRQRAQCEGCLRMTGFIRGWYFLFVLSVLASSMVFDPWRSWDPSLLLLLFQMCNLSFGRCTLCHVFWLSLSIFLPASIPVSTTYFILHWNVFSDIRNIFLELLVVDVFLLLSSLQNSTPCFIHGHLIYSTTKKC